MVLESSRSCVRRIENDVSGLSCLFHPVLTLAVQSYLQHYTEPSSDTLSTAATHSDALLPLGQGTLTHNASGIPIVVVCTKADLIDENNDLVGAGTSGMGGMVKGKGGEWEERTDSVMQILRTIGLKCAHLGLRHLSGCKLTRTSIRWRGVVLHNPSTGNVASSQAIRIASPLRTSSTITKHVIGRRAGSRTQSFPFPAQAEHVRP
jgi:hypothetical protein